MTRNIPTSMGVSVWPPCDKLYRATRVSPDSCINPNEQAAFYDPGLGSRGQGGFLLGRLARWIYRKVSQATGLGITKNIIDCYAALINPGTKSDPKRVSVAAYIEERLPPNP